MEDFIGSKSDFQKIYQIKEQQRIEILHDDGLRQQYDQRLLQELQQLRTQNEQEMQILREEIASQYEKKVKNILLIIHARFLIDRNNLMKLSFCLKKLRNLSNRTVKRSYD